MWIVTVAIAVAVAVAAAAPSPVDNNQEEQLDANRFHEDDYVHQLFVRFAREHQRDYATREEFQQRKEVFRSNLYKIHHMNEFVEQGSAVHGITKFADMTEEELRATVLGGLRAPETLASVPVSHEIEFNELWKQLLKSEKKTEKELLDSLPKSVDWRLHKGVVSIVKDQGSCGSCWAFSITGNLEAQFSIVNNETVSLSEQELVDCDRVDQGCAGGFMTDGFEEIIRIGGIESEHDYPYEGERHPCRLHSDDHRHAKLYKIKGYASLTPHNEARMKIWLAKRGPISVSMNSDGLVTYKEGVAHPKYCPESGLNHGLLLVGYGQDGEKLPYWILKNSWGADWGEKGFFRLFRGDNTCGVSAAPSTALVH